MGSKGFNLGRYIKFELLRGAEDSAKAEQLGYEVIIDGIDGGSIYFKLAFKNPELVSIGSKKDVVIGTIIDESFFCSADSPSVITKGSKITAVLPRLLPG